MRSIFEDFERGLVDVARDRAGVEPTTRRRSRHWTRPALRGLRAAPALAVMAICAVVVAIAVTSLHGSAGAGPTGVQSSPATPSLTGELSVLRRPQTAADREMFASPLLSGTLRQRTLGCSPASTQPPVCDPTPVIRSLVRRVEIPGLARGLTVGIYPERTTAPGDGADQDVDLSLQSSDVEPANTASYERPANAVTVATRGLLLITSASADANAGAILVPDGVSRVTLSDFTLTGLPDARTGAILYSTAPVRDNVAGFVLSHISLADLGLTPGQISPKQLISQERFHCGPVQADYSLPATAVMRWTGGQGQTLKLRRTQIELYARATLADSPARDGCP